MSQTSPAVRRHMRKGVGADFLPGRLRRKAAKAHARGEEEEARELKRQGKAGYAGYKKKRAQGILKRMGSLPKQLKFKFAETVRYRMRALLESLGGKSGLKPVHIADRDFGWIANMDKAAGGGPSAARTAELRARQRDNGTFQQSKAHIRKMLNIKKL